MTTGTGEHSDSPTKDQLKRVLEILSSHEKTIDTAQTMFRGFDKNNSGSLDLSEVNQLIDKLNNDVGLPPLKDERIMKALFNKFDIDGTGALEEREFVNLFAAILHRVRNRYVHSRFDRRAQIGKNKTGSPFDSYTQEKKLGEGSFGLVLHLGRKRSIMSKI